MTRIFITYKEKNLRSYPFNMRRRTTTDCSCSGYKTQQCPVPGEEVFCWSPSTLNWPDREHRLGWTVRSLTTYSVAALEKGMTATEDCNLGTKAPVLDNPTPCDLLHRRSKERPSGKTPILVSFHTVAGSGTLLPSRIPIIFPTKGADA